MRKDTFEGMKPHEFENQRLRAQSALPSWPPQIDTEEVALLVLCMYLVTITDKDLPPKDSMFSSLYRAAKRAFASLSCLSRPTLELIQCGALITLFEFGHGRSRFAYRTLSETLAMARTAGIKSGTHSENNPVIVARTEEDKRALWWGIFILDQ